MTQGPVKDHPDPVTDTQPTARPAAELPWQRLAPGMLLVEPVREIIKFIPMLIVLIFAGRAGDSGPPWGLIGTAAVIGLGISRWLTTRYRITPTVVEVRRGLLQRKHLTVPRERVRTVDVSAHPLQRLLRLVKVEIGTGSSHHRAETLKLDGLPAATAAPLRAQLLHRVPAAAAVSRGNDRCGTGDLSADGDGAVHGGAVDDGAVAQSAVDNSAVDTSAVDNSAVGGTVPEQPIGSPETVLARLDPRWIGYAPATLSGVVTGAVLIGLGWRISNEARLNPTEISVVHQLLRYLQRTPLWIDVLQVGAIVIVAVTVLSVVGYVLSFWGFRLTRHAHGTLQAERGLLTRRATSISERRLHGVHRSEPLLLRLVGGARLHAIATGLKNRGSERGAALLIPPAPLATVLEVESAVLGTVEPVRAKLSLHGPAAQRRRFNRALGGAALIVVVLFALSHVAAWLIVPAAISLLTVPLAALLARDRYRNLGHAVIDNRLITQAGSLVRHRSTVAIPGIVGLTLRQSPFQRRSGLISLTATTSAGLQHYLVADLPGRSAVELAVRLLPESASLLTAVPPPTATADSDHRAGQR